MFWLLRATGGFGTSLLFASFLGLLWGAECTHGISLLFGLVHFVVKFNFISLINVPLHLPGLGRVGAGDDVIQELVLLLVKERGENLVGDAPGVSQPMRRSGNELGTHGSPV